MYKKEIPDQVGNDSSEDDKSGMTLHLTAHNGGEVGSTQIRFFA
jgi:hypothetical protein